MLVGHLFSVLVNFHLYMKSGLRTRVTKESMCSRRRRYRLKINQKFGSRDPPDSLIIPHGIKGRVFA